MEREKFVINIGRQLGSGGKPVGEIIARRLGIKLYDKELINLAAEQSGLCAEFFEKADEKESRNVLSTMIGYLRSPFAGGCANVPNVLSNDALFKIQSDAIRSIAENGSAVFVGRAADYVLRDLRCLDVFVSAPLEWRKALVAERSKLSSEEAEKLIVKKDKTREYWYNFFTFGNWGVASNYDLCVDSSILGLEGTADLIIDFARREGLL